MGTTLINMPATGLASYVVRERACTAPNASMHGTSVPFAGTSAAAAQAALTGVRVTDLPGSPPRGVPV